MNLGLDDQTVLITGASGGIGRAMARVFGEEGARLVLHGSGAYDAMCEWAGSQSFADRTLCVRADVTRPEEVEAMYSSATERFGSVDIALVNAGVWPEEDAHLGELSEERVRHTIEVDLLGAIWTAREYMRRRTPRADGIGGSLLFTGSTAGHFGEAGHADYAAAKAGLIGLMRSLKNELPRIDPFGRVNVIEPGWTVTEMTERAVADPVPAAKVVRTMPLQQLGKAEDIARVAATLSSPIVSRHVSGQVVTVAGGMEGRVLWENPDGEAVVARLSQS